MSSKIKTPIPRHCAAKDNIGNSWSHLCRYFSVLFNYSNKDSCVALILGSDENID